MADSTYTYDTYNSVGGLSDSTDVYGTESASSGCANGDNLRTGKAAAVYKNVFGGVVWKLTLKKTYCTNLSKVTKVIKVQAIPYVSTAGSFGNWQYAGWVSGSSNDYYYTWSGNYHGGHHTERVGKMQSGVDAGSLGHYGTTIYVHLTLNVHYDGTYVAKAST